MYSTAAVFLDLLNVAKTPPSRTRHRHRHRHRLEIQLLTDVEDEQVGQG